MTPCLRQLRMTEKAAGSQLVGFTIAVHLNYRSSVRRCSVRTCARHGVLHQIAGAALQTGGGGRLRLGSDHLGEEGERLRNQC